jgi:hypothetical protein
MRTSYAMKLHLLGLLVCLPMLAQSRSIPASTDNIRELADVVLVGEVSEIKQGSHPQVLEITATVRAVAFDRDDSVAQGRSVSFRFVQFPHAEGDFQIGRSYVVSLGRCKCGNYVLIGSQFSAKANGEGFDTGLWIGFDKQTSFEAIKEKLLPPGERDGFLTDARCGQAWEGKSIP